MKCWTPKPYDGRAGRVTLGGDAAHPMLPVRGQGFQHAITDAQNYVEALVKIRASVVAGAREHIMAAYDAEMVERGAKAVQHGNEEARLAVSPKTVRSMRMVTRGHGRVD